MIELIDLVDRVNSRESFLEFAKALRDDFEDEMKKEKLQPSPPFSPGANGWENGSISSFLDASIAWTEAQIESEVEKIPSEPKWRSFAWFLLAGKCYE